MEIIFNIPHDLARQVASPGEDPSRVALEALAIEAYRAGRLSESAVREMLGFETRMQVHAFLKQHGIYLQYDLGDLEQDEKTAEKLKERIRNEAASSETRSK